MNQSILLKVVNVFRSRSHSALDRIGDPGAEARLKARDYATQVAKFEEQLASVVTEEKVLQKKHDDSATNADLWRRSARAAVQGGNDALAKEALTRQSAAETQLAGLTQSLAKIQVTTRLLKQRLDVLRQAKADAQTQAEVIDARAKAASATERSVRLLHSVGQGPAINFDDLQAEVRHREAHAEALNELIESTPETIDVQFAQLTAPSLEDRLAALKR